MPRRLKTERQIDREHRGERPQRSRERKRQKTAARGYDAKWTAFSRRYRGVTCEHPKGTRLCAECERQDPPIYRLATCVDHVVPLRRWLAQPRRSKYDRDNLQALCDSCHASKSARERLELGNR